MSIPYKRHRSYNHEDDGTKALDGESTMSHHYHHPPPPPPPQGDQRMTEINKPEWVNALDAAKATLRAAADLTPEFADSKTRLAYAWMDVAKLLKTDAASGMDSAYDRSHDS